jgi:hypothetical protein
MGRTTRGAGRRGAVLLAFALVPTFLAQGAVFANPAAPARVVRAGIECTTPTSEEANKLLECPKDKNGPPTADPMIAVDPADPNHMVVSAEDFTDPTNLNGIPEFYTTFDGGKTWTSGDIQLPPGKNYAQNQSLTFDARDGTIVYQAETAYLTPSLGFCNFDASVFVSRDGGLGWSVVSPVGRGHGCISDDRLDGYLGGGVVADNNPASPHYGRVYLAKFYLACIAAGCLEGYDTGSLEATIRLAHSDDGGFTWTALKDISGSNPTYCTDYVFAPACDASVLPWPAVSPDGSVHVEFENLQNQAAWEPGETGESQIMVVSSDDGGVTWSSPVHVTDLENGSRDLSISAVTLVEGVYAWNLAASPIDGTLYTVFEDNRNGVHDVDHPVANLDVFVMSSTDGGATWAGPDVVSDAPQWQWTAFPSVNPTTGDLGVEFLDRSYGAGDAFDVTLATGRPGAFTLQRVTTVSSPLHGNLWYPSRVPGCETCPFWIGEFVRFAYGSDGTANLVWTDLRRYITLPKVGSGHTENIFYAKA